MMSPCCAVAQSAVFEVASIKPAHGGPIRIESDPGRLTITNNAADTLIRIALGLREYQYQGPAWLHVERYDIVATTSSPEPHAAQIAMLRALLVQRFKLTMHRETKSLPVYALIVGKNGTKLKAMDEHLPVPLDIYSNFRPVILPGDTTEIRGVGTLGLLCDLLSRIAGRPVLDATGIAGGFEIRLLCAIDGYPGFETSPSVFEAVQSQLGLKLEARSSPVEITVIDRAERPGGN
jgi:uncharacterized protein (TIGR03435 family)